MDGSLSVNMSLVNYSSNVKEPLVNVESILLIQTFLLNSSSVLFMTCYL